MNSRRALQTLQKSLKSTARLIPVSRETTCHVRIAASMPSNAKELHGRNFFSSVAIASRWDKHCDTCTCEEEKDPISTIVDNSSPAPFPCGNPNHEDEYGILPPPLPEPKYSVHKRILPSSLTGLSSTDGRKYLMEAMTNNTAESYWSLTEQFVNQLDPAFCGVTTLLMVLNAMCIDPQIRWRGGWRFYGSEDVLLGRCCLSAERIRRVGLTLDEFRLLGRCNGLSVQLKRPKDTDGTIFTVDDFRNDIQTTLTSTDDTNGHSILVVSFSRAALGQTGEGHFSPLAAYHEPTDQVLLLDVARFKYSPYWVPVQDLYDSMGFEDSVTQKSRGWFLLDPPKNHACLSVTHEDRRPAELVPQVGDNDACPVGKVKVDFCQAKPRRS